MGQFFIVQGRDPQMVGRVFAAGVRAFASLAGQRPSDRIEDPQLAAAVFSKLSATGPSRVHHSRDGAVWGCSAGVWLHPDAHTANVLEVANPFDAGKFRARSFDGAFALAFGNRETAELVILTDRLGTLHAYRAEIAECRIFSTSSMVLAALAQPRFDPVGCREFLATGTVFEHRTLFQGIEKLPPATVMQSRPGTLPSKSVYWNLPDFMYDRARGGDAGTLAESLQQAVSLVCRKYRRPLFDLTGGFDSRAVLAAAMRNGHACNTVVTGWPSDPDVVASRRIAAEFALPHCFREVTSWPAEEIWRAAKDSLWLCDGEYDVLLYAWILRMHSWASAQFDASVNGSAGEVCRGYWWDWLPSRNNFDERKVAIRRFLPDLQACATLVDGVEDLGGHFADMIRNASKCCRGLPNTAHVDHIYLTFRMQRWQGRIASASNRIFPSIAPFAFGKTLEAALSASPRSRVRNRMARRTIELLSPKLAALPMAQGGPALPLRPETAYRFGRLFAGEFAKAFRKVARRCSSPNSGPAWDFEASNLEEVRDLLVPARMLTRSLYKTPLRIIPGTPQFGRALTLEMLARAVAGFRQPQQ